MPPDDAPKSSARPSCIPVERSSTAATSWNRRTSSRSPGGGQGPRCCRPGPGPRPRGLGDRPGAPRRRPREPARPETRMRRGIDRRETGGAHLEPRALTFGAEPVLAAADHPQPGTCIAVERQHDVDGMLQGTWPGEVAVLGDVAGHDARRCRASSPAPPARRRRCAPARPRRAPGSRRCREAPGSNPLRARTDAFGGRGQDLREVATGCERDLVTVDPQPTGSAGDLGVRLLAGDQEARMPVGGDPARSWSSSVDLPIPVRPRAA